MTLIYSPCPLIHGDWLEILARDSALLLTPSSGDSFPHWYETLCKEDGKVTANV